MTLKRPTRHNENSAKLIPQSRSAVFGAFQVDNLKHFDNGGRHKVASIDPSGHHRGFLLTMINPTHSCG